MEWTCNLRLERWIFWYLLLGSFCLSSQTADSSFNLGRLQFEIGNYDKALKYFNQTIALQHNYKAVNYIAGLAEYNLHHYQSAIDFFSKEIIYNPKGSKAYLYKAISFEKLQKYDSAFLEIEKALQIDPNNALIVLEKGHILFDQKKYEDAIPVYQNALSLNRKLEIAYYKLGFCEYNLNNRNKACSYWKNIQDIDDFENYEIIINTCHLTH